MWRVISRLQEFIRGEDGPTAVEYGVMLAFIVMGLIAVINAIGGNVSAIFITTSSSAFS
jgi:pilus assembly protein Flp/PilA